MTVKQQLIKLGVDWPDMARAYGSYVPAKQHGLLIYVSGQLPRKDDKLVAEGLVGDDVTLEQAREAAKQCVANALGAVEGSGLGLNNLAGVLRVGCFVASAPGFTDQPKVANAASELLHEIFGEAGQHVRAAVGVAVLPMNAAVEIEFVFEARPEGDPRALDIGDNWDNPPSLGPDNFDKTPAGHNVPADERGD